MGESVDDEILRDLRTDPEAAFRRLYDRYAGPLLRFLFRFTGSQEAAEELLHDLFIELLKGSFQDRGDGLKNWLFTVARNKGLNHRRRARREIPSEDADAGADPSDLEEGTISAQLLRRLAFHEKALPEDLAVTWRLRREGLDYEQIAARLGIPIGTVKSRFHRLVRHLQEEFRK